MLIEQLDLGDRVAMLVQGDQRAIRAARKLREGWRNNSASCTSAVYDRPADDFPATAWDEQEWQW